MDLLTPLAAATVSVVARRLVDLGYENIRAVTSAQQVRVWYENRRRPDPMAALAEVLAAVAPLAPPDATVSVIPLSDDQPLLDVETTAAAILRAEGQLVTPAASATLEPGEPAPGTGHREPLVATIGPPIMPPRRALASTAETTDITIQPAYRFNQTSYALLARAYANAPISSGLRVFAQVQAPVYPKLGVDPAIGAIYSSGWLAPDVPAQFDVGFNGSSAQVGGEAAYEIAGGLGMLELRGGLAQNRFPELIATAAANLPWWDLSLAGGWGTYELGDFGPFATLTRTFPRSAFQVGAFDSGYGLQFRATFSIDYGPDPRPAPSTFRVIPFGRFQTQYAATAYQAAQRITPGPSVADFLDRMTPAYVRAHLDRLPWPR